MREPCAEMIAGAVEENLRLVLQPAKGARMNDPRAIALKFGAVVMAQLGVFPSPRLAGFLRERREDTKLVRLHLLPCLPNPGPKHWTTRTSSHTKDYPSSRSFASLDLAIEKAARP
jgi:hypothetical protein